MRLVLAVLILAIAQISVQAGDSKKEEPKKAAEPKKVACVGDSITAGSYPAHLQKMLDRIGDKYVVKNFGVSGATMMMKSDRPYTKQKAYENALKFEPDIIVLMLGTNDTRKAGPNTYQHIDDFVPDGKKIVESFQAIASKPKIFLCIPVPIYGEGNFGLNNENLVAGVIPGVRKIAAETNATLLDMNTPLSGHADWFRDRVHPNDDGARTIAATAYRAITGREPPVDLVPAAKKK